MSRVRMILALLAAPWGCVFPGCAPVEAPSTAAGTGGIGRLAVSQEARVQPQRPADPVRDRVKLAIDHVQNRDLLTTHGFWTVFHGILGLGPRITLTRPETGERVNALDYIASGGEVRGLAFIPTRHGLDVQIGPLFVGQGHQDQFIAEMAQWNAPLDRKFLVNGKEYEFRDFVEHAKKRARLTENQELSWAVLVIGHYHGPEASWINAHGEPLTIEDLVRYEMNANLDDAPCGGTHRLFGLSWVYQLHRARGGQPTGLWTETAAYLDRYAEKARQLQNRDGTFSTSFFRGPGDAPDVSLRMNTTGHILEWLALHLPSQDLNQPWVQNAAQALALLILDNQSAPIEGGTLYHAVHGLLIYYARVYGGEELGPSNPPLPGSMGRR